MELVVKEVGLLVREQQIKDMMAAPILDILAVIMLEVVVVVEQVLRVNLFQSVLWAQEMVVLV